MKREFSKLSKAEQEQVELEYHRMKPEGFDKLMAGAKPQHPDVICIPQRLVETLDTVVKEENEPG